MAVSVRVWPLLWLLLVREWLCILSIRVCIVLSVQLDVELREAIASFEEALEVAVVCGAPSKAVAQVLLNLAGVKRDVGSLDDAHSLMAQAHALTKGDTLAPSTSAILAVGALSVPPPATATATAAPAAAALGMGAAGAGQGTGPGVSTGRPGVEAADRTAPAPVKVVLPASDPAPCATPPSPLTRGAPSPGSHAPHEGSPEVSTASIAATAAVTAASGTTAPVVSAPVVTAPVVTAPVVTAPAVASAVTAGAVAAPVTAEAAPVTDDPVLSLTAAAPLSLATAAAVDAELTGVWEESRDLVALLNRCMFGGAALDCVRHAHSTLGFTLLMAAARVPK